MAALKAIPSQAFPYVCCSHSLVLFPWSARGLVPSLHVLEVRCRLKDSLFVAHTSFVIVQYTWGRWSIVRLLPLSWLRSHLRRHIRTLGHTNTFARAHTACASNHAHTHTPTGQDEEEMQEIPDEAEKSVGSTLTVPGSPGTPFANACAHKHTSHIVHTKRTVHGYTHAHPLIRIYTRTHTGWRMRRRCRKSPMRPRSPSGAHWQCRGRRAPPLQRGARVP